MKSELSMRATPWIVNVGLPRTGTTSFTRAAELIGLRALHVWDEAEHDLELLRAVRQNAPASCQYLSGFHAVSDTPFYALRDLFEAHYPDTRLICTTRPKDDWLESMIGNRGAGGQFLGKLYGLPGPPWREVNRAALSAAYDKHHATVCRGLPAINLLGQSDGERWRIFCSCLPDSDAHFERVRESAWPHENRGT